MDDSATASGSARKRTISTSEEVVPQEPRKRLRRTGSVNAEFAEHVLGLPSNRHPPRDRLPNARSKLDEELEILTTPTRLHHPRPLSSSSSYSSISLGLGGSPSHSFSMAGSMPGSNISAGSEYIDPGMALMRRVSSSASLASTPTAPSFPALSAKHFLRIQKNVIDFSHPCTDPAVRLRQLPLACSTSNIIYFSRGNRVHFKSLITNEDIGQLCKVQESIGDLHAIECGGVDKADIVALGTSKGTVQLWDVRTKKMTGHWTSNKGSAVVSMKWNGPVLTVGGAKGTIRHYDTRIDPKAKMKEQAKKMTRHQKSITALGWNMDRTLLASADESGTIYCWDQRAQVPLDVGEHVHRRKKMQHASAVTALAWSPWQAKLLATGDEMGTIRLWNVDANIPRSNALSPAKVDTTSTQVTSLHFSPQCKEILSSHGPADSTASDHQRIMSNSVMVHSFPSLRHVVTEKVSLAPLSGCVINTIGTKVVFAVPDDNKLKVWDAWGKSKEIKRQPSFMNATIR